jgi:hypothetical protein
MTDVEGGLRTWLRTLGTPAGTRVFVSAPPGAEKPYVVVGLIDAEDDHLNDAPLDVTLIQLDCFGTNKASAHNLYTSLRESLRAAPCGLTLSPGTTLKGVSVVSGTRYFPDENGTPRYIITAQVIVGP